MNPFTVSMFSQNNFLKTQIIEKTDKQVFVTTYNQANPDLMGIIRKYWPMIQTSKTLGRISEPPMCAFRRHKNLQDILVSAKLTYPPEEDEKAIKNHIYYS